MRHILTYLLIVTSFVVKAQTYTASEVYVHFFSPAPIVDIEAITNTAKVKLNLAKKDVEVEILINSFTFKKALMQTHFNEKYIESNKYPTATFKGKFKDKLDLNTDGVYKLSLDGRFSIHGVERAKNIDCIVSVKDNKIFFESSFKLLSANYKIEAPDIIYRKVGQEVDVDIKGYLKKED
ncbi:YceI family protein [Pedobacter alpinus]|uniref:YceI family protein n=1 Tax=Pedobacter alpinus TaxID=1590643 RepID=A0ABW5TXV6_9SPHI